MYRTRYSTRPHAWTLERQAADSEAKVRGGDGGAEGFGEREVAGSDFDKGGESGRAKSRFVLDPSGEEDDGNATFAAAENAIRDLSGEGLGVGAALSRDDPGGAVDRLSKAERIKDGVAVELWTIAVTSIPVRMQAK